MISLPETILQFGAGRFLRAFLDRFVHQANDAGQNVGRIVVVQRSADQRSEGLHNNPDGYRVLVRGYQDGELVQRYERVQSISRVLSADKLRNCCTNLASVRLSSSLVGSSNRMMGGDPKNARVKANVWRCPPERPAPFSPIWVSKPFGKFLIHSSAQLNFAASTNSASEAFGR